MGAPSWIDISATSHQMARQVISWNILNESFYSDHYPVVTHIALTPSHSPARHLPDWKKVDWTLFRNTLDDQLSSDGPPSPPSDIDSLERLVSKVSHALQDTVATCVPTKSVTEYSKAWWSDVIWDLRKNMNRAHNRWRRTHHPQDHDTYLGARRLFRQEVKRAKTQLWHDFCADTTEHDMWDKFKRISGKNRHQNIRALRNQDGQTLSSSHD